MTNKSASLKNEKITVVNPRGTPPPITLIPIAPPPPFYEIITGIVLEGQVTLHLGLL